MGALLSSSGGGSKSVTLSDAIIISDVSKEKQYRRSYTIKQKIRRKEKQEDHLTMLGKTGEGLEPRSVAGRSWRH